MKYFKNAKNELFVDPIVKNHIGLVKITKAEFDNQLSINNTPSTSQILMEYQHSAKQALIETDIVVNRVMEAVSLGLTTLKTADVIAFMKYRSALRAEVISSKVSTLPTKPPYPAGT